MAVYGFASGSLPTCLNGIDTWRRTSAAGALHASGSTATFQSSPAPQAPSASATGGISGDDNASGHHTSASAKIISITAKARDRLKELRARRNSSEPRLQEGEGLFLRLAVQSGGCSGLSYVLDIIGKDAVSATDHKEEFKNEEGGPSDVVTVVVDPKSLLYVVGTVLDYSDELIGGGFKVINPNATRSCGCGMSFGVPKTFTRHLIHSKPMSCSSAIKKKLIAASAPR